MADKTQGIFGELLREVGEAAIKASVALAREGRPKPGSIVPLYSRPLQGGKLSGGWSAVAAAHRLHPDVPVIAVVNPASGPGAAVDAGYVTGISELLRAGVVVAGYVSTKYGARPEAEVLADVDRWRAFYPGVMGVFFDEMSNKAGVEDYYRRLGYHARSTGTAVTIGNPGSDTMPTYLGILDTIIVSEHSGAPGVTAYGGWHARYPRASFGLLSYGVATLDHDFVAAVTETIGWVFLTNDTLPNPWDTVPPYFGELLGLLAE